LKKVYVKQESYFEKRLLWKVLSSIKGRSELVFLHRSQRLSQLLLCVFNPCVNLQGGYNNGGYGYRPSYKGGHTVAAGVEQTAAK